MNQLPSPTTNVRQLPTGLANELEYIGAVKHIASGFKTGADDEKTDEVVRMNSYIGKGENAGFQPHKKIWNAERDASKAYGMNANQLESMHEKWQEQLSTPMSAIPEGALPSPDPLAVRNSNELPAPSAESTPTIVHSAQLPAPSPFSYKPQEDELVVRALVQPALPIPKPFNIADLQEGKVASQILGSQAPEQPSNVPSVWDTTPLIVPAKIEPQSLPAPALIEQSPTTDPAPTNNPETPFARPMRTGERLKNIKHLRKLGLMAVGFALAATSVFAIHSIGNENDEGRAAKATASFEVDTPSNIDTSPTSTLAETTPETSVAPPQESSDVTLPSTTLPTEEVPAPLTTVPTAATTTPEHPQPVPLATNEAGNILLNVGNGQGIQKVFNDSFGWNDSASAQVITHFKDQLRQLDGVYMEAGDIRISSAGTFVLPQELYRAMLDYAATLETNLPEAS